MGTHWPQSQAPHVPPPLGEGEGEGEGDGDGDGEDEDDADGDGDGERSEDGARVGSKSGGSDESDGRM